MTSRSKLRLEIDGLRVESFAPGAASAEARGTVRAQSFVPTGDPFACPGEATSQCQPTNHHLATCGVSCAEMCHATGIDCA
jgi:hypothetical protein